MRTRIVTGLIMASAAIALLTLAPPWATYALFQVAVVILADEFYRITLGRDAGRDRMAGIVAATALVAVAWFSDAHLLPALYAGSLFLLSAVLFSPGDVHGMGPRAAMLLAGFAYVGLLVTSLVLIVGDFGPRYVLVLFAGVFAGDTGAFFAGKLLGKRKLYEKISPKKTWAGAYGGAAASILGVFLVDSLAGTRIPVPHAAAIGAGCAVFGQVGDLAESLFKRAYDVKDSGTLLPGHGGLLDRVDGVLFAAPFVWAWLRYAV